MNKYPANQILTVKELKSGEIMHCGRTGGRCMAWTVIDKDETHAYVKVGGTTIKMTGRDIRTGTPMYRVGECPFCKLGQPATQAPTPKERVSFVVRTLEAEDIASALSRVDNFRKKNTLNQGGAKITGKASDKRYVDFRANQIIKRLIKGSD